MLLCTPGGCPTRNLRLERAVTSAHSSTGACFGSRSAQGKRASRDTSASNHSATDALAKLLPLLATSTRQDSNLQALFKGVARMYALSVRIEGHHQMKRLRKWVKPWYTGALPLSYCPRKGQRSRAGGIRTRVPLVNSEAYVCFTRRGADGAVQAGLEPATSCLTSRCLIQLDHWTTQTASRKATKRSKGKTAGFEPARCGQKPHALPIELRMYAQPVGTRVRMGYVVKEQGRGHRIPT